jgi:hypothetical protein
VSYSGLKHPPLRNNKLAITALLPYASAASFALNALDGAVLRDPVKAEFRRRDAQAHVLMVDDAVPVWVGLRGACHRAGGGRTRWLPQRRRLMID